MRFWDNSALLPLVVAEPATRHVDRLVDSHPLRAADALQLAAAIVAAGDVPPSDQYQTRRRPRGHTRGIIPAHRIERTVGRAART